MFETPFASGNTVIHHISPPVRLLAALFGAIVLATLSLLPGKLAGLGISVGFLAASRPPLCPLLKRFCALWFFLLIFWITVPLSVSGNALWEAGPFIFSAEGVQLALGISLTSSAMLALFLALAATMPPAAFGEALERLHVPGKLVFLFLFSCCQMHILAIEWSRLRDAAVIRGFVPSTSLHTYTTFGNLIGMTFLRSLDRAERIHEAMLLRGFDGHFHCLARHTYHRWDIWFLIGSCAVFAVLAAVDHCPWLFPFV